MKNKNNVDVLEKTFDELYSFYETENSLKNVGYLHPMFYNKSFCENNSHQPPKPKELMTKQEFISKIKTESKESRWVTAFKVLYTHILKEK